MKTASMTYGLNLSSFFLVGCIVINKTELHIIVRKVPRLSEKVLGRVISCRTDRPWPAHTPDLSPLDHWFCGDIVQNVASRKPTTLDELKRTVEETAATIDEAPVHRAVENLRLRVSLCITHVSIETWNSFTVD